CVSTYRSATYPRFVRRGVLRIRRCIPRGKPAVSQRRVRLLQAHWRDDCSRGDRRLHHPSHGSSLRTGREKRSLTNVAATARRAGRRSRSGSTCDTYLGGTRGLAHQKAFGEGTKSRSSSRREPTTSDDLVRV